MASFRARSCDSSSDILACQPLSALSPSLSMSRSSAAMRLAEPDGHGGDIRAEPDGHQMPSRREDSMRYALRTRMRRPWRRSFEAIFNDIRDLTLRRPSMTCLCQRRRRFGVDSTLVHDASRRALTPSKTRSLTLRSARNVALSLPSRFP